MDFSHEPHTYLTPLLGKEDLEKGQSSDDQHSKRGSSSSRRAHDTLLRRDSNSDHTSGDTDSNSDSASSNGIGPLTTRLTEEESPGNNNEANNVTLSGTRSDGLTNHEEDIMTATANGNHTKVPATSTNMMFPVDAVTLANLANDRTVSAMALLLRSAAKGLSSVQVSDGGTDDIEAVAFSDHKELENCADALDDSTSTKQEEAAVLLTRKILKSDPSNGLPQDSKAIEDRRAYFGSNTIEEKEFDSFLQLMWDAVQDFVLIMLIVLGVLSIA